LLIWFSIRFE